MLVPGMYKQIRHLALYIRIISIAIINYVAQILEARHILQIYIENT